MRDIKFRAWDGEKMVIVNDIVFSGKEPKAYWRENSVIESSAIIMQFTGLHDKNGKEIYEGDILGFWDIDETDYKKFIDDNFPDFNTWDGKKLYKKSEIKWSAEAYGWRMPMQSRLKISMKDVEVIGNIYETPELLTPKQ